MADQTPPPVAAPPPASATHRLDAHEPRGTPEDAQTITAGLSPGSLGQTIALPAPRLVHDFRMRAQLEGKVALGQSCWGERNWIGICGGEWSATWGKGTVVVRLSSLSVSLSFLSLVLLLFFLPFRLHKSAILGVVLSFRKVKSY